MGRPAKVCTKCDASFEDIDYRWWNRGDKRTWHPWCKACRNESQLAARQRRLIADPEGERAKRRAWWLAYMDRHPDRLYEYRWVAQLVKACKAAGISEEDYWRVLDEQGGVCKICRQPQSDGRMSRLAIDHNHETGEFRGLLCAHCNAGLGHFKDDINVMEEAIRYLIRAQPGVKVVAGGCVHCGCGLENARHGNADSITIGDVKKAMTTRAHREGGNNRTQTAHEMKRMVSRKRK